MSALIVHARKNAIPSVFAREGMDLDRRLELAIWAIEDDVAEHGVYNAGDLAAAIEMLWFAAGIVRAERARASDTRSVFRSEIGRRFE